MRGVLGMETDDKVRTFIERRDAVTSRNAMR